MAEQLDPARLAEIRQRDRNVITRMRPLDDGSAFPSDPNAYRAYRERAWFDAEHDRRLLLAEVERLTRELAEARDAAEGLRDLNRKVRQQRNSLTNELAEARRREEKVRAFRDECRREVARRDAMRMHGPHIDARDVAGRLTVALAGEGTADQPPEGRDT